ncbi:homocysteine S-methyltransferase [Catenisphaera adipataccumulans]|jgi:homocysteine S-methyltransferase|uniref:S-methylmethionine:homocysteine methyltransferase n=1 Tax=Catenisphaera adipataccumulans TaxID=700500 RepID=A0A7W8CY92_9FIRM|nr:homocysteine S-methyltransferase [Catenisphaera adipataccumulans]MBB5183104.1 homocysteine S-methyltransferase [Catenisphaera adipataccumulans]
MKRTTIESILKQNQVMVIDGSMATGLEHLGCDLNDTLWTAKVLADRPDLVKQVHIQYFQAGADCGITDSYQASLPRLIERGYSQQEAEALIRSAVTIFREAREEWWQQEGKAAGRAYPVCLGAVGPYGAYLADGSEYRGHYGVSDEVLRDFHARRMELLWQAGADVLMIETQPSLQEALIEAELAEQLGADYAISFSCADGKHINEGDLIADCAAELSSGHPHLRMIGVNCTHPKYIESLIKELKTSTSLPISVYPNSGEQYDPLTKKWYGAKQALRFKDYALIWMKAGAKAVGGCCQTDEDHIRQVAAAREEFCSKAPTDRI